VIKSSLGTLLNPGNFYNRYRQQLVKTGFVDEAGKPTHNFHDLRHTATTVLVQKGVHPRVAMEILGHSEISVTMNVYAHVVGDSVKDALTSIEDALGDGK
jgi:integrase